MALPPGEYGLCPRVGDARNIEEEKRVELRLRAQGPTAPNCVDGFGSWNAARSLAGVAGGQVRERAQGRSGSNGSVWGTLRPMDDRLLGSMAHLVGVEDCILLLGSQASGLVEECNCSLTAKKGTHRGLSDISLSRVPASSGSSARLLPTSLGRCGRHRPSNVNVR